MRGARLRWGIRRRLTAPSRRRKPCPGFAPFYARPSFLASSPLAFRRSTFCSPRRRPRGASAMGAAIGTTPGRPTRPTSGEQRCRTGRWRHGSGRMGPPSKRIPRPRPLLRTDASSAASATRMPRRSRRTVRRAARTRLAPASLRTDLVVAAAATGLVAVADPANTPPRVIRALRAATDRPKLLRPAQAPQRRERRVARPRPSPRRTQFSPRSPHV